VSEAIHLRDPDDYRIELIEQGP